MEERQEAAKVPPDDDDVSVNDTAPSEQFSSDHAFEVTRILAETVEAGTPYYLVSWDGYPEEKSTWEPRKNLTRGILNDWIQLKQRQASGLEEPFNLEAFEARIQKLQAAKADRLRRRKIKRRRLGLPVQESDADDSDSNLENNASPGNSRGTKALAPQKSDKASERSVPVSKVNPKKKKKKKNYFFGYSFLIMRSRNLDILGRTRLLQMNL